MRKIIWLACLLSTHAFAEDLPLPATADSKFVECTVEVSGGELQEKTILEQKRIELKFQAEVGWIGTGELQIDPKKKHEFKLRKTMAPGIDLITKINKQGFELGFFGLQSVELNFEQAGYATQIVCKDSESNLAPPQLSASF